MNASIGEITRRDACLDDVQSMAHCDGSYLDQLVEWRLRDYRLCIKSDNVKHMVVEAGGLFAGYVFFERHGDSLEIVRMAVDPVLLRCGIGTYMVHTLQSRLGVRRGKGLRRIWVDTGEDNLRSQRFFRSLGFKASLPIVQHPYGVFYRLTYSLFGERLC